MCIPTPNTGQLNPLFHTFPEFRLIVNRIVTWQSTDWLVANAQFSPNGESESYFSLNSPIRVDGPLSRLCCGRLGVWLTNTHIHIIYKTRIVDKIK